MALLEVRDLKIAFYDTTPPTEVVKGISFSLEEGETLGIVGESGSGKTQTALSILQLLKDHSAVSGGEILYQGKSLTHAGKDELGRIRGKEISMIFQEPMTSLNPVLTIEEQIAEGLLLHETCTPKERHEKVLAMMREVELPDPETLCRKYPHQLSGGQRQRVMIAAALITHPKLLIADEPTTALDVTIQSQILKLLRKMNERHHTAILFISHDLGVIRSLCSQVVVMNHGTIVENGSTDDVFFHPKEEYTRRLLVAIPNRRTSLRRPNRSVGNTSVEGNPAKGSSDKNCPAKDNSFKSSSPEAASWAESSACESTSSGQPLKNTAEHEKGGHLS